MRLKSIVAQLGNVELLVSAEVHGKRKPITTDLFKIKNLSTIQALETIRESGSAGGLGGLFYHFCDEVWEHAPTLPKKPVPLR